jgi:hypothetical protein
MYTHTLSPICSYASYTPWSPVAPDAQREFASSTEGLIPNPSWPVGLAPTTLKI